MALEYKEKWNAVIGNDSFYDGIFYYGVKTTGIFCRPSCKSKEPKPENVSFFDNIDQAYHDGLRPCKRCRPDLIYFNPMDETIEKAGQMINTYFTDPETLSEKLKELRISQNYFISLFRSKYGITPVEYIKSLRMKKATELLSSSELTILDIAIDCGFGSLSTFYEAFKKYFKMTPKEYRKTNGGNTNDN